MHWDQQHLSSSKQPSKVHKGVKLTPAGVPSRSYDISVLPGSPAFLWGVLWPVAPERRGKLNRMMMKKLTSTQKRAGHTVLTEVRGLECSRSQGRRVAMSFSMAFIWKCVPRMAHTWKSWWLWPAGGAVAFQIKAMPVKVDQKWA